jgi:hypothetical protein
VLLVGDGPYHRDEVAAAVETPVTAVIPVDRRSANALDSRTARSLTSRAPLVRSARQISATLVTRAGTAMQAQA